MHRPLPTPNWKDSSAFTIFFSRFATEPSAGPRPTTRSRACSVSYCQPRRTASATDAALQLALRAVLVSPHFLFLQTRVDHDPASTGDSVPINDFDLASRISYFLWSSMPDEQLFRAGRPGIAASPRKPPPSGQADAAGSQGARTGRELRQPVAADAQAQGVHARPGPVP